MTGIDTHDEDFNLNTLELRLWMVVRDGEIDTFTVVGLEARMSDGAIRVTLESVDEPGTGRWYMVTNPNEPIWSRVQ